VNKGILVYMNVNGRIRNAMDKVAKNGGNVIEPTHQIGQHGFRSILLDSEDKRIVLHSNTDA
jgi:predicted enzyme related to lactoylglutathione lyase